MKLWAWMRHLRKYKMRIEEVEAGLEESPNDGIIAYKCWLLILKKNNNKKTLKYSTLTSIQRH